jgi:hypothetical protein
MYAELAVWGPVAGSLLEQLAYLVTVIAGCFAAAAAAAADEMFVLASEELSTMTDMEELEQGR